MAKRHDIKSIRVEFSDGSVTDFETPGGFLREDTNETTSKPFEHWVTFEIRWSGPRSPGTTDGRNMPKPGEEHAQ